jgi:hypothetical protein
MTKLDRARYLVGTHTAEDGTAVNFDGRFTVGGYRGVAFYLLGWAQRWTAETWELACDDEDCAHSEEWCWAYSEPEQADRTDMVIAVMVGDDRQHTIDVADLAEIDLDAYCTGCGQTGCGGDFRHAV